MELPYWWGMVGISISGPWIPWVEPGDVEAAFNPNAKVIPLPTIVSELFEEGIRLWNEALLGTLFNPQIVDKIVRTNPLPELR
ncbi:hypothetical protein TorRG33x02_341550 [Trema orientale]|uniref:Uncharacterized protein n=1 Tax=Trema orientale TaxID=63057 RepID=A0A2P5ATU0_TREOI|nr:hypothetical protein TorRG33x02_341550 [Trema orientale]